MNAFNLMALLGGFRQSDSAMLLFMSYKGWALALVLLFFAYLAYLVYRRRDAEMYLYLLFLLPFGFFMLSTRMHERYLFPCLLFLTLLLPRRRRLWVLFGGLTVTYYLNLWYILRALNAERFLEKYEPFGVAVSVAERRALRLRDDRRLAADARRSGAAAASRDRPRAGAGRAERRRRRAPPSASAKKPAAKRDSRRRSGAPPKRRCPLRRSGRSKPTRPAYRIRRRDLVVALLLMLFAGGLRFWHLGQPDELVFDEVYFVEQGKNYLRGKEFMDPHPPLAKLAIGASVALFGGEAQRLPASSTRSAARCSSAWRI